MAFFKREKNCYNCKYLHEHILTEHLYCLYQDARVYKESQKNFCPLCKFSLKSIILGEQTPRKAEPKVLLGGCAISAKESRAIKNLDKVHKG